MSKLPNKLLSGIRFALWPLNGKSPLQLRRDLQKLDVITKTKNEVFTINEKFDVDEYGQQIREYKSNTYRFSDDQVEDIKIRANKINRLRFLARLTLICATSIATLAIFYCVTFLLDEKPFYSLIALFSLMMALPLLAITAKYAFLADGLLNNRFHHSIFAYLKSRGFFNFVDFDDVSFDDVARESVRSDS